ncbi:hypothetical protein AX774_g6817 [Zancudomyces culisetae]|uniref:Uncharacterized protein n=1 Tax=Zancudomyces culisetae TaxID=1213189 RepID=A0A1R1PFX4_ZANCU|nr:hypothetical protein AX774_g6817 [Zancudomyces culisetae]|eukprot:OMH79762.1 hypothetical protein AX774_g6817 [Zancudomyces culisetae]
MMEEKKKSSGLTVLHNSLQVSYIRISWRPNLLVQKLKYASISELSQQLTELVSFVQIHLVNKNMGVFYVYEYQPVLNKGFVLSPKIELG